MLKYMHNVKSRAQLEKELDAEQFERIAVSFYRYIDVADPTDFRDRLYARWYPKRIFGRVYVAEEGINAQLSVPVHYWAWFKTNITTLPYLSEIFLNRSKTLGNRAFLKLDVKVRSKILADGLNENILKSVSPGPHLSPQEFHEKIASGTAVVVDARNHYECETGHFKGAILPQAQTFSEMLPELKDSLQNFKEKDVLMYCTGGIRCEKTSAYLKKHGYQNVYQLQGGIINYLNDREEKRDEASLFEGSMFVFDGRMAEPTVNEVIAKCHQCGNPFDRHVDCANVSCHKLFIQCPQCAEAFLGCCSPTCRELLQAS